MSRSAQFNRPVEYDPSLLRQQQAAPALAAQFGRSASLTREQAMKDEFGFDGEEESKQNPDAVQQAESRIRTVAADDDLGQQLISSTPARCPLRCSASFLLPFPPHP